MINLEEQKIIQAMTHPRDCAYCEPKTSAISQVKPPRRTPTLQTELCCWFNNPSVDERFFIKKKPRGALSMPTQKKKYKKEKMKASVLIFSAILAIVSADPK